ncbi:MAG: hypothetical protein GC205_09500 [Bacteroidetes bacterium]|nr:hypothetical protein [Bacteroidota bacterium]
MLTPPPLNLWSCPRNVSTAMMYSFAQRPDCRVWDEPLYAHFLRVTGVDRPDREATLAARDADGERVIREDLLAEHATEPPLRLFKHISNQFQQLDPAWLGRLGRHVIFIRHPARIVASYARVIEAPTLDDVAMDRCAAMFRKLRMLRLQPLVLDSRDLLEQPEAMLRALCGALDIPFYPAMLHWTPGPRPEDGPWAQYWYHSLHQSSGFNPPERPLPELHGHLAALSEACLPAYAYLQQFCLKAQG